MGRSRKLKIAAAFVLVGAYLFLQRMASEPHAPAITPPERQSRTLFPVDFKLPDLQDRSIRLADLRGQVVLLNFWATWCYPCRTEMPSMHALYNDYRDRGFAILAISSDVQGKEVVVPFVEEYGLTFPVLLDPRNVVATRLQVQGIPASYVLDKLGRIAGMEMGARDWNSAKMRRVIETLLAEDAAESTP